MIHYLPGLRAAVGDNIRWLVSMWSVPSVACPCCIWYCWWYCCCCCTTVWLVSVPVGLTATLPPVPTQMYPQPCQQTATLSLADLWLGITLWWMLRVIALQALQITKLTFLIFKDTTQLLLLSSVLNHPHSLEFSVSVFYQGQFTRS